MPAAVRNMDCVRRLGIRPSMRFTGRSLMALFNKKSAAPQQKSADFALLPNHVGIIMDGNGRWAKKRGLPRFCRT